MGAFHTGQPMQDQDDASPGGGLIQGFHEGALRGGIKPGGESLPPPKAVGERDCHFVGHPQAMKTPIYDELALAPGTTIDGPAIVVTRATTYLVEPGWRYRAAAQNAVWFTQQD